MGMGRRFERGDSNRPERVPRGKRSWVCRALRGLCLDRNPLRRGTDRLEAGLLAGLFVAAAAGAPFAAHAAAQASYANALRVQREQLASTHLVRAVLTQAASTEGGYSVSAYVPAAASWTSVSGVHWSGEVLAQPRSPRGTVVTVRTDDIPPGSRSGNILGLRDSRRDRDAALARVPDVRAALATVRDSARGAALAAQAAWPAEGRP